MKYIDNSFHLLPLVEGKYDMYEVYFPGLLRKHFLVLQYRSGVCNPRLRSHMRLLGPSLVAPFTFTKNMEINNVYF